MRNPYAFLMFAPVEKIDAATLAVDKKLAAVESQYNGWRHCRGMDYAQEKARRVMMEFLCGLDDDLGATDSEPLNAVNAKIASWEL